MNDFAFGSFGDPPGLPAPAPTVTLTRRQKAAVIVRLLVSHGEQVPLAALSIDHQAELTEVIGKMRSVNRSTLRAVVEEFLAELDALGLSFPGGIDAALEVLDGHISSATVNRLRRQSLASGSGDPWARIAGLGPQPLLAALQAESIEVGAVILSKLSVARAAELLAQLPGERARKLARAIAETSAISPENVRRIGLSLVQDAESIPEPAFETTPVERVGAILNYSPAATRDDVLEGLDLEDAEFAAEVRKAIFTFLDIPNRIDGRDVTKVTKAVETSVLVTALAAALAGSEASVKAAEFLLAAMSQRMAGQLRDEVTDRGKVKAKEGEDAMGKIISAIRELEAKGEIVMVTNDGKEE